MYIGNTIQNKRSRISYKNRKLKSNPQEKWNIVENTHEPIIEKQVFDKVQKMIIVQKYNRNEKKHNFLLDGLLVCYECKHKIGVKIRENGKLDMVCNNYRRNSKLGLCTSHGFSYEKLESQVLEYIRQIFKSIDSKKIELTIQKAKTKYDYSKLLKKLEIEVNIINDNIDKMYIDKLNGKLTEEMYERLFRKLREEAKQKEKEYILLKQNSENAEQDDTKSIKKVVNDFLQLEKPTPEIMKVIVNKIEIHQDKQVDIFFNFKN